MLGEAAYPLTEWNWLKTQLRLRALELNGQKFVTRYTFFDDKEGGPLSSGFPDAIIQCSFWCETTDRLLEEKAPRANHLRFYPSWVEAEYQGLNRIVALLPTLSQEFQPKKHLLFTILHDYGGGSVAVCHFYGGTIHWKMASDRIPE